MKHLFYIFLAILASVTLNSCEDSLQSGSSLVEGQVEIVIDSTFTVTGKSIPNPRLESRTVMQLLGSLHADGYGAFSSEIVCQYMPAATLDTIRVKPEYIDSVKLMLTMTAGGFAGDSITPMGLRVYPLTRQLTTPIYSTFDPKDYYDPSVIYGSTTYSALLDGATISADANGYLLKSIGVKLPTSLGVDLYNEYINHPQTFATPEAFAKFFPGLYIANSFGEGRVTRISSNVINVYYHSIHPIADEKNPRDTTVYHVGTYMGVTPEVITNNDISYTMASSLEERARNGEAILVGPIGYDVEFEFPAKEIIRRYREQAGELAIVNSLSLDIPAVDITNDYGLMPPPYVLLVKKSEKDAFFNGMKLPDNVTSFYASYSSATKSYTFASMRDYIVDLLSKDEVKQEDTEFVICPVLASFYQSSQTSNNYMMYYYYGYSSQSTAQTLSSIAPYVTEPVMTLLDLANAKINFSFSRQTL
ncbi:MAG: DUF4270 domain-containing protein [Duncaniella sp.]|nr:DUF4270 domain-containing protein [Duncaniella sp.]